MARLEDVPPTSHGYWYSFARHACKNLISSEAIAVYCTELVSQNGNSRLLLVHFHAVGIQRLRDSYYRNENPSAPRE